MGTSCLKVSELMPSWISFAILRFKTRSGRKTTTRKGRIPPAYRMMKMFMQDDETDLLKLYIKRIIDEFREDEAGRQQWIESHRRRFLPESEATQPMNFTRGNLTAGRSDNQSRSQMGSERVGYVGLVVISNLCCMAFRGRSWNRAVANVAQEGGSITVGNIAGYAVGVTAGFLFTSLSPLAILGIGALVGLAASYVACNYFEKWTLKWLGLTRDEKLEKAYNLFEVKPTDSNSVVNKAYRQKSKTCHPDKLAAREPVPSKTEIHEEIEKFLKYQDAIKTIRDAREKDGAFPGNGVNDQDEEEICWREKVINFLKRLNPWWDTKDKNLAELLPLTYDFPPISIFEDGSAQPEVK
ncbi:DnaJ-like protein DjlA [Orchesella cincta]|uniref:DnaJ-like protein DjlA n=1 Tax=Orchesella cincta TaxID=48709 RepID=A0A1D2M6U2_ORCCI|nr:DnaJ-like protein DjlA [Orchesella cincta]